MPGAALVGAVGRWYGVSTTGRGKHFHREQDIRAPPWCGRVFYSFTSQLIEDNEKQVNTIYLSTVAQDVDGFTAQDANALFAIANQCPLVGGNAVYRARALYALINDDQEYDDPSLCLAQGITVRSMQATEEHHWRVQVMPNPARNEATLVYHLEEGQSGTLLLHDPVDRQVSQYSLSNEVDRFPFSTANLAPGTYHYSLTTDKGLLGEGKLTIIH